MRPNENWLRTMHALKQISIHISLLSKTTFVQSRKVNNSNWKSDIRKSHPIQTLGKRINNKRWDLIHQIITFPRMQNSSELSHVWSRHVFYLLIPIVHNPALPLAIRRISCCKGNMISRVWRPQFPHHLRHMLNGIQYLWSISQIGVLILYYQS